MDTELTELTERFESHRTHLRAVGYRMLGSVHEADDVVQDAWLRLARIDAAEMVEIENLGAWLTTVVSRLCLDRLRTRAVRGEEGLDAVRPADLEAASGAQPDPAAEAELADSVGQALGVVLATLSPAERLAFVLHDLFGLPFEQIGAITGRSTVAVRQLASRGRRRVRRPEAAVHDDAVERATQARVVEAFLVASREGDLRGLLELLDPAAVVRSDAAAAEMGSPALISGGAEVAAFFDGRARAALPRALDGYAGAVWQLRGEVTVAFAFTLGADGAIVEIELLADPDVLARIDVGRL